ncbi:MAG: class I SAM-dependent methyltransferase [Chloroflexota bacterium]
MTITLNDLEFLSSAMGEVLLERLSHEDLAEANTLRLLTVLRKDFAAEQAGAALEMARLRLKAVDKFGDDAWRLFFTRAALEQASDPLVRAYRAGEILTPPPRLRQPLPVYREGEKNSGLPTENDVQAIKVLDAGCGIGADSLAFAALGAVVLGLDMDIVRVEIARHNAAALGLKARFEVADIREGLPDAEVAFFDPARRDDKGNRIYDVERYEPPLSLIRGWKHPLRVVKLSPGVDLAQVVDYGGGLEFISVAGDLKEAVLWLGGGWEGYRATLLVGENVYRWENATPPPRLRQPLPVYREGEKGSMSVLIAPPRGWLVEPDPAILRAGLVQDVTEKFNGFMLDETIAYFTTETKPDSPWGRAWRILDWMPFNLKQLRAYLREKNVGNVTVKKRGSPLTPETLIPQLKLKGDESRTLVLTRLQGQPIVMICETMPG